MERGVVYGSGCQFCGVAKLAGGRGWRHRCIRLLWPVDERQVRRPARPMQRCCATWPAPVQGNLSIREARSRILRHRSAVFEKYRLSIDYIYQWCRRMARRPDRWRAGSCPGQARSGHWGAGPRFGRLGRLDAPAATTGNPHPSATGRRPARTQRHRPQARFRPQGHSHPVPPAGRPAAPSATGCTPARAGLAVVGRRGVPPGNVAAAQI